MHWNKYQNKKRSKTDPDFVASLPRKSRVKHRNQRKDRGWSDIDAWNGDLYLSKVISEMAIHYKAKGIHPFEYTPDEWNKILDDIIAPLQFYNENKFGEDDLITDEHVDNARKAMHLFAQNFDSFFC